MMTSEHHVLVHRGQHQKAKIWCRDHLGPRWHVLDYPAGRWACFWNNSAQEGYRFYFASESDCAWFALKWA